MKTAETKKKYHLMVALVNKIYDLCCLGFRQDKSTDFKRDVAKHIVEEDIVCVVMKNETKSLTPGELKKNNILCFISYRTLQIEDEKIVYFSGVVVDPEFQGQGIASSVMEKVMKREEINWAGLRTQNPVMRESLKKICSQVFPSLSDKNPPAEFMMIGHHISDMLGMTKYDIRLMTEKGTYGEKSLYGNGRIPTLTDDLALNAAFMKKVKEGDSMIVIGRRET